MKQFFCGRRDTAFYSYVPRESLEKGAKNLSSCGRTNELVCSRNTLWNQNKPSLPDRRSHAGVCDCECPFCSDQWFLSNIPSCLNVEVRHLFATVNVHSFRSVFPMKLTFWAWMKVSGNRWRLWMPVLIRSSPLPECKLPLGTRTCHTAIKSCADKYYHARMKHKRAIFLLCASQQSTRKSAIAFKRCARRLLCHADNMPGIMDICRLYTIFKVSTVPLCKQKPAWI